MASEWQPRDYPPPEPLPDLLLAAKYYECELLVAQAERDDLRALLREARAYVEDMTDGSIVSRSDGYGGYYWLCLICVERSDNGPQAIKHSECLIGDALALRAKIDAALAEGAGDGE